MKYVLSIVICLGLTGCLTANLGPTSGPKCPTVYKWTKDYRAKLADEVKELNQSSPLAEAIAELTEVRDWMEANCK